CSGSGKRAVYRVASDEELERVAQLSDKNGGDELAWVLIYREGPLSEERLQGLMRRSATDTAELVQRLLADGRVQKNGDGSLSAQNFVVALGAPAGWEAAVFDHVQAVVQTICQRLEQAANPGEGAPVGGSTYSLDVWPGHPLEQAAKSQLRALRERLGALREQVDDYNREHGVPREYQQVIAYVGQCQIERTTGVDQDEEASNGSGS
ncbi:MAG TPA: hypothetical protein VNG33_09250, partial [Polyangiaceae bacterium]|nr:hypothetical protein [Polyangiaceae bacterium]